MIRELVVWLFSARKRKPKIKSLVLVFGEEQETDR